MEYYTNVCKHCDTRHDTYLELVNYYTSSRFLFPEMTPSFNDLVDDLDCCSGCRNWLKIRFAIVGGYYERQKKKDQENEISQRSQKKNEKKNISRRN